MTGLRWAFVSLDRGPLGRGELKERHGLAFLADMMGYGLHSAWAWQIPIVEVMSALWN